MIRLLELFGGIGACSKAFEKLGIEFMIADYVEIDSHAVASFNAIHGTHFEPQDICKWDKDIEVDFIMHGSPCQDFSLQGKQAGGDEGSGTRSSLMYETLRIVQKLSPKYVLWENVRNLVSDKHRHNFNNYLNKMEELGYKNYYQLLNGKEHGLPQNRVRMFTLSIRNDVGIEYEFPDPVPLSMTLRDMCDAVVDEKYYLSEKVIKYILSTGTKDFYYKPEIDLDIARPLTSTMHKMHRASQDNYVTDSYIRNGEKLLIKEATSAGYAEAEAGDFINLQFPNSNTRRGRVGKQVAQTLLCNDANAVVTDDMRIRRLTPLECFRLMGFGDEDFYKAEKVNSNTQLYRQAGNSIMVNVLEAIIRNLLVSPKPIENKQMSLFDMED